MSLLRTSREPPRRRTCLSVAYGTDEAVVGEMDGLDGARGLVISEGHQGGVVNHLGEPRRRCVPVKTGEFVKKMETLRKAEVFPQTEDKLLQNNFNE